ncbi:DUF488 domain-containing protein [Brachymonas denitrificans]|uniref:DUF488 domain-containing protein n=1 Tax=Brachymonas denitrificans TaxID=28220 RepID=UPI002AFEB330|nr:DUF488 family protein [Brachymonas denitrificans]
MYHLQRAYDFDAQSGQHAVLLDRLWPRGLSKQKLAGVLWEKDATPSTELRHWLHEDQEGRFDSFSTRFTQELTDSEAAQQALQRIRSLHREHGALTLLTAARDPEHSHLSVLAKVLKERGKTAS